MQPGSTDPNKMLTTQEAADLLGLQPSTLAAWREDGSQPELPFSKFGKSVRYRYADLVAFIGARRASSTLAARQLKAASSQTRTDLAPAKPDRRRAAAPASARQPSLF
jgi:excisionase family DNA binding protein